MRPFSAKLQDTLMEEIYAYNTVLKKKLIIVSWWKVALWSFSGTTLGKGCHVSQPLLHMMA